MPKYKFKVGETVYPLGLKRVFPEGGKHHQKWEGKVTARFFCKTRQKPVYIVENPTGLRFFVETSLTRQKERHLCYLLVKDIGVFDRLEQRPEVVPEGQKLLSIMVIPND